MQLNPNCLSQVSTINGRKSSCGKVMFLHVSVRHSVHRGYTPPRQTISLKTDTPLGRHSQADTPQDGHCSGQYASYWNAFLLTSDFENNFPALPIQCKFLYKTAILNISTTNCLLLKLKFCSEPLWRSS